MSSATTSRRVSLLASTASPAVVARPVVHTCRPRPRTYVPGGSRTHVYVTGAPVRPVSVFEPAPASRSELVAETTRLQASLAARDAEVARLGEELACQTRAVEFLAECHSSVHVALAAEQARAASLDKRIAATFAAKIAATAAAEPAIFGLSQTHEDKPGTQTGLETRACLSAERIRAKIHARRTVETILTVPTDKVVSINPALSIATNKVQSAAEKPAALKSGDVFGRPTANIRSGPATPYLKQSSMLTPPTTKTTKTVTFDMPSPTPVKKDSTRRRAVRFSLSTKENAPCPSLSNKENAASSLRLKRIAAARWFDAPTSVLY